MFRYGWAPRALCFIVCWCSCKKSHFKLCQKIIGGGGVKAPRAYLLPSHFYHLIINTISLINYHYINLWIIYIIYIIYIHTYIPTIYILTYYNYFSFYNLTWIAFQNFPPKFSPRIFSRFNAIFFFTSNFWETWKILSIKMQYSCTALCICYIDHDL